MRRSAVRHLVERNGNYYARVVVPSELRRIIGKTELREPLGSNRSSAERKVHAVAGRFLEQLEEARFRTPPAKLPAPAVTGPLNLLTFDQIASLHYRERLAFDEEVRNSDHRYAAHGFVDEQMVDALKRAIAGAASNEELRVVVGPMIGRHRLLGRHLEVDGTVSWRALARVLAMAELEFMRRVAERDEGDYSGSPPSITLHVAEPNRAIPVSIAGLFNSYIGELRKGGAGAEAERRWTSVFRSLVDYLGHDDACVVGRADIVAWKEKLLESLSAKTVRDTHIAAIRAVFRWATQNGKISANPAESVTVKLPKKVLGREQGLNDEEAVALLRECHRYRLAKSANPSNRESAEVTAAKQ